MWCEAAQTATMLDNVLVQEKVLKSKLSRTDRRTFRPRFRWEMLIHIWISPKHWKDASGEKRSLESDILYVFLCLKSIKVYRFNNTKESWHEFALKFGVIADYRGYSDIIEGIVTPPDEKENLEILAEDDAATKKSKKEKQSPRAANKKGFRDLVMSTDGISLNIVQNAVSDKLTRGDLKKAWG